MKTIFYCLLFTFTAVSAQAQYTILKAGGNLNADIVVHKTGQLNYACWEISLERSLSKKFSMSFSYNYSKRHSKTNTEYGYPFPLTVYGIPQFDNYNHAFILEGRYYLNTSKTGLFFQVGIPLTYTLEKRSYELSTGSQSSTKSFFDISTTAGFGLLYPLGRNLGIEMNISPSLNMLDKDYGSSGFIKTGAKLTWSLPGKNKK